ncbi:MAG: hypothetical protein PHS19_04340 [Eubacteriales bacterium]|nr:hypothetical protein [Eubacteriales bacterium]
MNLMNKYLGIMKHNKEYIVNIDTDATIPQGIGSPPPVECINKEGLVTPSGINSKLKHAKTPDKSDKSLLPDKLHILQPPVNLHSFQQWDGEMQELIIWYKKVPKPTDEFLLDTCRLILCPEKYFDNIDYRISQGPTRLENRFCNLREELKLLRKILGKFDG